MWKSTRTGPAGHSGRRSRRNYSNQSTKKSNQPNNNRPIALTPQGCLIFAVRPLVWPTFQGGFPGEHPHKPYTFLKLWTDLMPFPASKNMISTSTRSVQSSKQRRKRHMERTKGPPPRCGVENTMRSIALRKMIFMMKPHLIAALSGPTQRSFMMSWMPGSSLRFWDPFLERSRLQIARLSQTECDLFLMFWGPFSKVLPASNRSFNSSWKWFFS